MASKADELIAKGIEFHQAGNLIDAGKLYEAALRVDPRNFDGLNLLGTIAAQTKNYALAISLLEQAININPWDGAAHNNLGNVYFDLDKYSEAIKSFKKAQEIEPNNAEAFNNMGNALRNIGRYEEAIECFQKALKINPHYADPYNNLGTLLAQVHRYEESISCYQAALQMNPSYKFLRGTYLHTKLKIADWTHLDNELQELKKDINLGHRCTPPFPLLSICDSPRLQKLVSDQWISEQSKLIQTDLINTNSLTFSSKGKIRIGYYSADFKAHPVMFLLEGVFRHHDHQKFEIYAFSYGAEPCDEVCTRVKSLFKEFIDIKGLSDQEVIQMSKNMGIDIAVDLTGHTFGGRMNIFAGKAAPIGVNFLGYSGTLGGDFYDYIVADEVLIPPQQQEFYSEKIAYLPHSYMPNDLERKVADKSFAREEFGLKDTDFVFCCFNNAYKFNLKMFGVWMRLLKNVPNSILWITENNPYFAKNIIAHAALQGINADRIIFAKRMDQMEDHLARQKLADLFLDTHPYNAHTTAADALMVGLPLLTMAGESFTSRVAASLLHELGLEECISSSIEEYEKKALELAFDPSNLRSLRERLNVNIRKSAAFDPERYAKNIEDLYTKMYDRYHDGLAPTNLYGISH